MITTVHTLYFSPTHTGRAIAQTVSGELAAGLGCKAAAIDWTRPQARTERRTFGKSDLLVFAFPVYGGRIPPLLEAPIRALAGDGTPAILLAVYGNRAYEDALLEASDLLTEQGFCVAAAGAFIGEHSYTANVAGGRPDAADLEKAKTFAALAVQKLRAGKAEPVSISGNRPYKERKPGGAVILPKTSEACVGCGQCVEECPMGVISADDPTQVEEGCIRCCACVKACPVSAKYFDAEPINNIVAMLEANCAAHKEPEWFL